MKSEITTNVRDTVLLWTTNLGAIGIGIADLAIIITIYNQAKKINNDK